MSWTALLKWLESGVMMAGRASGGRARGDGGSYKNGVLTSGADICVVKLEDELPESDDVRMRLTRLEGEYRPRCSSAAADAWPRRSSTRGMKASPACNMI